MMCRKLASPLHQQREAVNNSSVCVLRVKCMGVCLSMLLPSVYQFVWVASKSARTFPGVSLS